jgi:membrane-associated phospholipid phosphatase
LPNPVATDSLLASLGDALGAQALGWFVAMLVLLLIGATIIWRLVARFFRPRDSSAAPSPVLLIANIAVGFTVIVGASLAFAELAEEVGEGEVIVDFDERLSLSIGQHTAPATLHVFAALTRLGDPLILTVLCVLVAAWLLLKGRRGLALAWVVALAGNGILNQTLKQVFERVRPLHEHGLVQAQGWSFPSGHSSGALVAYGMLAYVLVRTLPARWHLPLMLLATALAFTVGSSRVFLQVHFASDVAAGFLSGTAWLCVTIASVEMARRYPRW